MATVVKDLGAVTAYAYAVEGGYTGTESEFEALLGNIAEDLSEIENLSVTVTTLPAGSSATASYSNGVLSLGIPKGDKGDTGVTPNLSIGTVSTLPAGDNATASVTGTAESPILNLGIPAGQSGDANNLAADYSSTKTYAVGDYCIYNGSLYRCTTAITTAEAWTAAHWTAAVLGDDVGDLKSAVGDVRVEATVENVITVSQATETISGTHIPTITYGENNSLSVVLANTGTNIWGYTFETVIGKTYNVSLDVISGGEYAFSIYIIKDDLYSSSQYITQVSDVVTGQYSFDFTAITATSTLWFSVNRKNQTCSMRNITVTDKSAKGWKYGSLQTTFVSEDFPPTSKAVGDAITPHITGETNIFVGQSAGKNTVESQDDTSSETYDKGRYNAALGFSAMLSNTEGHHNTAVGFSALKNNTTGAFNTAIGEDALYDSTTQSGNTGVGSHVMQKNTGGYNVAVGAENSRYPTNMEYSVAIGYHANYSNYNGTNNVFIGAAAGPSADVDNCIAIGTQATVSDDNQIVIGNASNDTVIIAGKVLTFNLDGSVTWTAVS